MADAPFPRRLTTSETLDTLSIWQSSVRNYFRKSSQYQEFFRRSSTWNCGTQDYGLTGEAVEDRADHLQDLLDIIASLLPDPAHTLEITRASTNIASIWDVFSNHCVVQPTQSTFMDYTALTPKEEGYLEFYAVLMNHTKDHLCKKGADGGLQAGGTLTQDDVLTLSHRNHIALDWLQRISPRLPYQVKVLYSKELKTGVPLASLVPKIAENMEFLLSRAYASSDNNNLDTKDSPSSSSTPIRTAKPVQQSSSLSVRPQDIAEHDMSVRSENSVRQASSGPYVLLEDTSLQSSGPYVLLEDHARQSSGITDQQSNGFSLRPEDTARVSGGLSVQPEDHVVQSSGPSVLLEDPVRQSSGISVRQSNGLSLRPEDTAQQSSGLSMRPEESLLQSGSDVSVRQSSVFSPRPEDTVLQSSGLSTRPKDTLRQLVRLNEPVHQLYDCSEGSMRCVELTKETDHSYEQLNPFYDNAADVDVVNDAALNSPEKSGNQKENNRTSKQARDAWIVGSSPRTATKSPLSGVLQPILSATRNEGVPTATCEKLMAVGSFDSLALHNPGVTRISSSETPRTDVKLSVKIQRLDMSKYKKSAINSRFITPEDEDEAQPTNTNPPTEEDNDNIGRPIEASESDKQSQVLSEILEDHEMENAEIPQNKPGHNEERKQDMSDGCMANVGEIEMIEEVLNQSSASEAENPEPQGSTVNDNTKLSCLLCDRSLSQKGMLRKHYCTQHFKEKILEEHGNPSRYPTQCKMCSKRGFQDDKTLAAHVGSVHKLVNKHIRREEKLQASHLYKCHLCNFNTREGRRAIYIHYASKHYHEDILEYIGDSPNCPICQKMLSSEANLIDHVGVTHHVVDNYLPKEHQVKKAMNGGRFTTEKQPKLSSEAGATDNKETRQKVEHKHPFECKICTFGTSKRYLLNVHYSCVHFENDIMKEIEDTKICYICGHEAKSRMYMVRHFGLKHRIVKTLLAKMELPKEGEPKLPNPAEVCQLCNFKATNSGNLFSHYCCSHFKEDLMKLVAGQRYCNECDFEVNEVNSCEKMMNHYGRKHDYIALLLGKAKESNTDQEIQEPQTNKSNEPKKNPSGTASCQICGKLCKNGYRKVHQSLTHFKEDIIKSIKNFSACDLCGHEVDRKNDMIIHYGRKHGMVDTFLAQIKENAARNTSAESPNNDLDFDTSMRQQDTNFPMAAGTILLKPEPAIDKAATEVQSTFPVKSAGAGNEADFHGFDFKAEADPLDSLDLDYPSGMSHQLSDRSTNNAPRRHKEDSPQSTDPYQIYSSKLQYTDPYQIYSSKLQYTDPYQIYSSKLPNAIRIKDVRSLLADESPGIAMATSATTLAEPQRGEDRTEESTATANTRFWATVDKPPHNKYNH